LGAVAHLKGITVCEVGREIAVIGDRDIGAFFAEMDVVAVVVEAMGEQTGSLFLAATDYSEQHGPPLEEVKARVSYKREGVLVSG